MDKDKLFKGRFIIKRKIINDNNNKPNTLTERSKASEPSTKKTTMAHNTRSKNNYNNNPTEENNSNVSSTSNTKQRHTNFLSQNFRKSRLSGLSLTNLTMTSYVIQ